MPSRKNRRRAKVDNQTITLSAEESEDLKHIKAHIALQVLRDAHGVHSVEVVGAANRRLAAYLE